MRSRGSLNVSEKSGNLRLAFRSCHFGIGHRPADAGGAVRCTSAGENPTKPGRVVWTSTDNPVGNQRLSAVTILALMGFTIAAFWRTLHFYFLSDDFVLVKLANTFHFAMRPMFGTAGGDGFFRPIGYISLAVTSMWAGLSPTAWHITALALHIINCVLVFMLAIQLGRSRMAAIFAAALFAVHGTRPEAVAWIAGRFDLVATFFVLAGLLFFVSGNLHLTASLVCMAMAILSKESAYIFPLLLVLAPIADLRASRTFVLIPFFVTAAGLFAYRCWLFGGIGGYKDAQTGKAQALTVGMSTAKALGIRVWTALFFPINWSVEPGVGLTALTIAYIGALVWLATSRPNRALMTFALGFVIASILPPLHLLVIGMALENSRLLYLPSVGFCLMLAVAAEGLKGRVRWIVPGVILAFNFAALQHNLDAWEYASERAQTASAVAMKRISPGTEGMVSGLPGSLRGVPFFANGFPESIELQRNSSGITTECHGMAVPRLIWDGAEDKFQAATEERDVTADAPAP
jgi:hypothetical protein